MDRCFGVMRTKGSKRNTRAKLMYRALDVKRVLEVGPAAADGEFKFHVDDPHIAENRGTWQVIARDGSKTVEKSSGSADFEMSIAALLKPPRRAFVLALS